MRVIAKYY
jgi:hypothetical protein